MSRLIQSNSPHLGRFSSGNLLHAWKQPRTLALSPETQPVKAITPAASYAWFSTEAKNMRQTRWVPGCRCTTIHSPNLLERSSPL